MVLKTVISSHAQKKGSGAQTTKWQEEGDGASPSCRSWRLCAPCTARCQAEMSEFLWIPKAVQMYYLALLKSSFRVNLEIPADQSFVQQAHP